MMESVQDMHVVSARVQKQIEDYLGMTSDLLLFEFSTMEGKPNWT